MTRHQSGLICLCERSPLRVQTTKAGPGYPGPASSTFQEDAVKATRPFRARRASPPRRSAGNGYTRSWCRPRRRPSGHAPGAGSARSGARTCCRRGKRCCRSGASCRTFRKPWPYRTSNGENPRNMKYSSKGKRCLHALFHPGKLFVDRTPRRDYSPLFPGGKKPWPSVGWT